MNSDFKILQRRPAQSLQVSNINRAARSKFYPSAIIYTNNMNRHSYKPNDRAIPLSTRIDINAPARSIPRYLRLALPHAQ